MPKGPPEGEMNGNGRRRREKEAEGLDWLENACMDGKKMENE